MFLYCAFHIFDYVMDEMCIVILSSTIANFNINSII